MGRPRLAFSLALALLAAGAGVVLAGAVLDPQPRQVGALVAEYLAAIESQDLEAALGHLAPEQRGRWRDFIANQLGNRHRLRAVSVRAPSLLDRWLGGQSPQAISATVVVDVNPGTPEGWQSTTVVRLAWRAGRWSLLDPPLAPAGE